MVITIMNAIIPNVIVIDRMKVIIALMTTNMIMLMVSLALWPCALYSHCDIEVRFVASEAEGRGRGRGGKGRGKRERRGGREVHSLNCVTTETLCPLMTR